MFDTAIFDLDGTLLDSLADLAASANAVLRQNGYPTRTLEEIRSFVGDGGRMLIGRVLPAGVADDERTVERLFQEFSAWYDAHKLDCTRPYPGIPETLARLADRGVRMAVVSNKMNGAVVPLVAHWFGRWIPVAVGEGEGVLKKPDPNGVWRAIERLQSRRSQTVYIGDSDVDIRTARNAGVFSVGCSWGFRDRSTLERAGAQRIVDRPQQLLELFLRPDPEGGAPAEEPDGF